MEGLFSALFLDVPYINNCVSNFFFDVIQIRCRVDGINGNLNDPVRMTDPRIC